MQKGFLTIILPSGEKLFFGQQPDSIKATIRINNQEFFRKCIFFGDVGFGEAYVAGDWGTDDIVSVISWMILNAENHPTLMGDKKKVQMVNCLRWFNRLAHQVNKNTPVGSRRNIARHYDLSNEFFKTFLDSSMTYSAAYFKQEDMSLLEAQIAKYDVLCQKLRLNPKDNLLEIGCGWGGFAMHAAKHYGCQITTVTISNEQFKYVKDRIDQEGLQKKIDIRLCDYRHLTGQFDKIVSIEMIEAVGHQFLKGYFSKCFQLLKKDGLLGLQMILAPDHRYESFRKNVDWIQKYIFPGSLLPSIAVIFEFLKGMNFNLFAYEDLTPSYVKTLKVWRENFNQRLDDIRALNFDEAFVRQWNYYLSYCEAAFVMRNITVAQAVFTRSNNLTLMN